jgi:hypothetical protein
MCIGLSKRGVLATFTRCSLVGQDPVILDRRHNKPLISQVLVSPPLKINIRTIDVRRLLEDISHLARTSTTFDDMLSENSVEPFISEIVPAPKPLGSRIVHKPEGAAELSR